MRHVFMIHQTIEVPIDLRGYVFQLIQRGKTIEILWKTQRKKCVKYDMSQKFYSITFTPIYHQYTFTYSKSTIETLKKCVKYVQINN